MTMQQGNKMGKLSEQTFCGDLDVGAGDCDLMFLAEEPADGERETERGNGKEDKFKCFPPLTRMTQHESGKHKHTKQRGAVAPSINESKER